MEKINIAELLKDCPIGMELDSPVLIGKKTFKGFRKWHKDCPIEVQVDSDVYFLTIYGQMLNVPSCGCVIFPKGKTTWEGFTSPCEFKDGDIVATCNGECIGITTGDLKNRFIPTYCVLKSNGNFEAYLEKKEIWGFDRLATEEEKQKLFKAMKDNGYRWNADTKTLEKLIKPKFKVGDRIQGYGTHINHPIRVVKSLEWDRYRLDNGNYIKFGDEHAYKLLKFNIAALKPFDKVLVRYDNDNPWVAAHFSHYTKDAEWELPYFASGTCFRQCIPFEGNQHLLGTTNDCDELYKTWE